MIYGDLYSPAADRNKEPIYKVIKDYIKEVDKVLEIGSASGQHAIYLLEKLGCNWQASDQTIYIDRMSDELRSKLKPIEIEIGKTDLSQIESTPFDVIYTANTLHIMSWEQVLTLFKSLKLLIKSKSRFVFYGPQRFGEDFGAKSNEEFHAQLQSRDPRMGIRNYFEIKSNLEALGFKELALHSMPANNHLAVFELV